MEIDVQNNYLFILKKVYEPIIIQAESDDVISICQRDTGFELNYHGKMYEFKDGQLKTK